MPAATVTLSAHSLRQRDAATAAKYLPGARRGTDIPAFVHGRG